MQKAQFIDFLEGEWFNGGRSVYELQSIEEWKPIANESPSCFRIIHVNLFDFLYLSE